MGVDPSQLVEGDEWAYRLRKTAATERVQILAVTENGRTVRVDVLFLDDATQRVENVPASRLRVPWAEAEAYDALMANWQRIDNLQLDSVEEDCVGQVFSILIPEDAATLDWTPVQHATAVHDRTKLEAVIHVPVEQILDSVEWFELNGATMLSPAGTLRIAQAACAADPSTILDLIMKEEVEARDNCKYGARRDNPYTFQLEITSPQSEYRRYRKFDKPRHELLRQWCGEAATTVQERLQAAEAEVHRLDVLLAEAIDTLRAAGNELMADVFTERHERDRITPHTVRPIIAEP